MDSDVLVPHLYEIFCHSTAIYYGCTYPPRNLRYAVCGSGVGFSDSGFLGFFGSGFCVPGSGHVYRQYSKSARPGQARPTRKKRWSLW